MEELREILVFSLYDLQRKENEIQRASNWKAVFWFHEIRFKAFNWVGDVLPDELLEVDHYS